jgi:hypothetical protein
MDTMPLLAKMIGEGILVFLKNEKSRPLLRKLDIPLHSPTVWPDILGIHPIDRLPHWLSLLRQNRDSGYAKHPGLV